MKKETIKLNTLSVLVVCIMLMATLLTACSSGQAAATPANEETTKAEVKEETTKAEVKEEAPAVEQAEEVDTPEPTEEPTPEPEPTPEAVVYEGIDMESTLPGAEWIATFEGFIPEPKFVVYNDETNKKVIVENGQEVEFEKGDVLAAYVPNGKVLGNYNGYNIQDMNNFNLTGCYTEFTLRESLTEGPDEISAEVYDIESAEKVFDINCTLNISVQ